MRDVSRVWNDGSTVYSRLELDSHADTIVLGRNCVILSQTGRECDVSPFTAAYNSITNVPIVTGATAWTSQNTGETYILVFHEALWMADIMDHTLINPNQLRHYGVSVQDNPYANLQMHIATEDEEVYIPLQTEGTTIFLSTRTPTDKELHECAHIELTSKAPWNPYDVQFPEPAHRVEEGCLSQRVFSVGRGHIPQRDGVGDTCWCDGDLVCPCPQQIVERLISAVRVPDALEDVPGRRTFVSEERHRQQRNS